MNATLTDLEIHKSIKAGGVKRQQAIAALYGEKQLKHQVIAFVEKNSGNREDGIDIFHEGLITLDENIRKGKYEPRGQLRGYLFSVCRFLWLNRLKKNKRMVYTDDEAQLDNVSYETPESLSLNQEQKDIISVLLGQLGSKCSKILELWKLSYSMEEIATEAGLKNANVARKQRYNCYQRFLKIIDGQPNLKSILN